MPGSIKPVMPESIKFGEANASIPLKAIIREMDELHLSKPLGGGSSYKYCSALRSEEINKGNWQRFIGESNTIINGAPVFEYTATHWSGFETASSTIMKKDNGHFPVVHMESPADLTGLHLKVAWGGLALEGTFKPYNALEVSTENPPKSVLDLDFNTIHEDASDFIRQYSGDIVIESAVMMTPEEIEIARLDALVEANVCTKIKAIDGEMYSLRLDTGDMPVLVVFNNGQIVRNGDHIDLVKQFPDGVKRKTITAGGLHIHSGTGEIECNTDGMGGLAFHLHDIAVNHSQIRRTHPKPHKS